MVDKTQFSKDFDETFGSRFLNNSKLNNTNLNNSTILKTDIFNETSNNSFRLDLIYLNNVINDCKGQIKEGEDYEIISRNYQNLISSMSRKFE